MKKLIAFLIFLLSAMQGATAQEVLGQQIPLSLDDDYKTTYAYAVRYRATACLRI